MAQVPFYKLPLLRLQATQPHCYTITFYLNHYYLNIACLHPLLHCVTVKILTITAESFKLLSSCLFFHLNTRHWTDTFATLYNGCSLIFDSETRRK